MGGAGRNVRDIFEQAVDCTSVVERAAYLDRACGGDTALRGRIEALLRAHQRAGHFLEGPPEPGLPEACGAVLGNYKLLEPIGEGGFGIVYRAEQQQPVRRRVALKVLRPGMDGRQVIARFEAERQALALMDHPNIARVLDAGEAPPAYVGGPPRPYVVMELVEGVPLIDFCDQERLTPRERLELFTGVCQAVQHAHQKGIIHRDLKPSNILVARPDTPLALPSPTGEKGKQPPYVAGGGGKARGVVKVIDFGIAKALDQRLTDKTLVTGVAQVVGTPLYMSPEQAEPGAVDIDTRSDIYTLGVLLYELLSGTTPFDRERLREVSFDELRRIIREEEPPRPSARVSTLGPVVVTLSEQRRTDPRQLGQLLRGELDWVVMKCLEKDRSRRYQTADALARDVARYLADEPVEACPPSLRYRVGKFVRKHHRPLLTAAAFLVLLVAGGFWIGGQAVREARLERDRVVAQAKHNEAVREALDQARALRDAARQAQDPGKWARAREQAQRALALVENGPADEGLATQVRQVQGELDEEEKDRRLVADLEAGRLSQAETVAGKGRFAAERAIPQYRKAFRAYGLPVGEGDAGAAAARLLRRPPALRQAVSAAVEEWIDLATVHPDRVNEPHLDWLRALAAVDLDADKNQEIRLACLEQDPARRRAALEKLAATADPRQWQAATLTRLSRRLQAVQAYTSAVTLLRRAWLLHPADFWVNEELGILLWRTEPKAWTDAVRHLTVAVALRPDSAGALMNLGSALKAGGQRDEAIACYRRAVTLEPGYTNAHFYLGVLLQEKHLWDEAIASFRAVVALDPNYFQAHTNLGAALARNGQRDEAIACFRRAIDIDPKAHFAVLNLGAMLEEKGQLDEAITCCRRAIDIEPKFAEAHCTLGRALRRKGDFHAALASMRTGNALGSQRKGWPHPSAEWVKQCERCVQLDDLLTATLKGTARPAGAAECLELAEFCRSLKQFPAAAVAFYTQAFTMEPKLAADVQAAHRYRAAQAAALAGCGQGQDGARIDAAEQARLRRQALEWLRADLALWMMQQATASPQTRQVIADRMHQWVSEPNLAGVRDEPRLVRLPADERRLWQGLWADVATAQTKAQEPPVSQPARRAEK